MTKSLLVAAIAVAMPAISMAQAGVRPGEPTIVDISFNYNGGNPVVNGTFTAPTVSSSFYDPQPLTEIGYIEVTRACYNIGEFDEPVAEFRSPQPGETLSFTDDTLCDFGYTYTYTIVAYSPAPDPIGSYQAYKQVFCGVKPAKPEIVSIATGDCGAAPLTVTVKAPALDFEGKEMPLPLSELRLVRDSGGSETPLTSFASPELGQTYTYIYNDIEDGDICTLRLYASTALGTSEYASKSVKVGEDVPAAPQNLVCTAVDGCIDISWTAPAYGLDNGYLNPESILYRIDRSTGSSFTTIAENLAATNFVDKLEDLDGPAKLSYRVTAYNTKGDGGCIYTDSPITAGRAYSLPFVEDFNEGGYYIEPSNIWSLDPDGYSSNWDYSYYDWSDWLTGVDGDDYNDEGYAVCDHRYGQNNGGDWLISSPISLKDAKYPVLTYHYAAISDRDNRLAVSYSVDGEDNTEIDDFCISENAPANDYLWIRRTCAMPLAAGKEIRLLFKAYGPADGSLSKLFLDAIRLDDYPPAEGLCTVNNGSEVTLSWSAPSNSLGQPDKYDVCIEGLDPVSVEDTSYTFAADPEAEYTATVVAHYGDIESCASEPLTFRGNSGVASLLPNTAASVEYFDVYGRAVANPAKGSLLLRRTTYADGSVTTEKIIK